MKPPRKRMFGEVCVVWRLICLAIWQQFTLCFRPPGKSGFQVARCIAVHSNNFSYDMKAKWNTKIHFQPKTGRWNSWGELSCFRGTSTYTNLFRPAVQRPKATDFPCQFVNKDYEKRVVISMTYSQTSWWISKHK